jgi:Phage integrase family
MRKEAADKFVFGNEVGEQVGSIKTAWRATCRHSGIRDLHFHDLRREFGSRLLESGAAQHDVRDFLGHANITTTSRYLKSTPLRLERALTAMEAGFAHDSHTDAETAAPAPALNEASTENKPLIQEDLEAGGEGQNRTVDTTIFSRMLYQLSYLADREHRENW